MPEFYNKFQAVIPVWVVADVTHPKYEKPFAFALTAWVFRSKIKIELFCKLQIFDKRKKNHINVLIMMLSFTDVLTSVKVVGSLQLTKQSIMRKMPIRTQAHLILGRRKMDVK